MTEERILSAVERIDEAMTRIEVAAASRTSAQSAAPLSVNDNEALSELTQRHDLMRGRVEAAIAELDMLIRNG